MLESDASASQIAFGTIYEPLITCPLPTESTGVYQPALADNWHVSQDGLQLSLHLRPGVRDWFMQWLARDHPDLVPRYHELYGRNAYAPKGYRQWLALRIKPLIRAHGLEHGLEDPVTGGVRSRALARPAPAVPAFPGRPVPGPGLLIAGELPPELHPTLF